MQSHCGLIRQKTTFLSYFFMVALQPSNPLVDSDPQMCSMLDSGIQTFPGTRLLCSGGKWRGGEGHTLFLILHRVGHVWTVYVAPQTGRFTIYHGVTWVDRT